MQIEIICTGDEVLTGKTINTNFSYISQKLEDVGLAVRWGTTVGDDRETLLQAFLAAGQRADAVIVNGALARLLTIYRRKLQPKLPALGWISTKAG